MSVTTQIPAVWPGSIVTVDHASTRGKVFRVVRVNASTMTLEGTDGRQMRASHSMVKPTDQPFAAAPQPEAPVLHPGTVVIVSSKSPKLRAMVGQRYVVLKENGSSVSIAKLGGDNGRYVRISPSALTAVAP